MRNGTNTSRRAFLAGLLATPAVVAASSLMPLRGVKFDPLMRVQSWAFGAEPVGEWMAFEERMSKISSVEALIKEQFGLAHWKGIPDRSASSRVGRTVPSRSTGIGNTSDAIWDDRVEPYTPPEWLRWRSERSPNGFNIWQPWSSNPQHHEALQKRWDNHVAEHNRQEVAFLESTRALQARIEQVAIWGR